MTGVDGLPSSLANNPRLSTWLTVGSDGRVLARSGKVELGQGILTALAQIVADELDVDLCRVTLVPASTAGSPDESYTAGSLSIQHSGAALRQVAAEVRALYLEAAGQCLGGTANKLQVTDGTISAPDGGVVTYWALASRVSLDCDATGAASPKLPAERRVTGRSAARRDLVAKIAGHPAFIHDMRLPGHLHGRVVRPPSPGATLASLGDQALRPIDGVVAVVRDGSFLGVLATREEVAVRAAQILASAAEWREGPLLPANDALVEHLTTAEAVTDVLHDSPGVRHDSTSVLRDSTSGVAGMSGARSVTARFSRPYLAHGSIGPSCAVARWASDSTTVEVWSHSQGIHNLRHALAEPLRIDQSAIVVFHVAGAGCYGHNGADDAALDAALLARAMPGRPVQVVWSRADEMTWSPLAPAMVVDITVDVDADGRPCRWQQDIWSSGHAGRPWSTGHPPLLAAMHLTDGAPPVPAGDPPMANGGGAGRNSIPHYDVGAIRVVSHRLQATPLRTSAMRALGAHLNVYAIEQVIDELAIDAGADPVAYRLGLLADPRARAVIGAAAEAGRWGAALPVGTTGRGVGYARYKHSGAYCAVVAEVEAETEVRVTRLAVAADIGAPVNPDGAVSQLEGGALQALSWTLREQVRFDGHQVTSRTWAEYPILTFSDAPDIEVVLVGDPASPSLGAGEASIGPTAAAVGNALAAALGVRVRDLPLTPTHVVAALG